MTEKRKLSDSRPSEQTRQALIGAGLALFGEKGFDATSTREIAAAAEANIGSIAYHFGNKQGLRIACANYIVDTVSGVAGRALSRPGGLPQEPEAARAALASIIETMAAFLLTRPEADAFVQFLLREIAQPGKTVEIIYDGVFFPVHSRLCQLWEDATVTRSLSLGPPPPPTRGYAGAPRPRGKAVMPSELGRPPQIE